MVPWAEEAGETANPPNPFLKAQVGQARAVTGMIGSLLGGWIASFMGRRRTYFLISLAALFCPTSVCAAPEWIISIASI